MIIVWPQLPFLKGVGMDICWIDMKEGAGVIKWFIFTHYFNNIWVWYLKKAIYQNNIIISSNKPAKSVEIHFNHKIATIIQERSPENPYIPTNRFAAIKIWMVFLCYVSLRPKLLRTITKFSNSLMLRTDLPHHGRPWPHWPNMPTVFQISCFSS